MQYSFRVASLGVAALAASLMIVPRDARAQAPTFDHLTCVKVSKDDRFAKMPPPLTLTSEQAEFLTNTGCKPLGSKIARADEVCYPTSKSPSNPPGGTSLSGEDLLCYRVKCAANGGGKTELSITDQFGNGTIFANEKPVTKKLCVPAFLGAVPTPTASGTPGPTPTPGATPTPTAAPTATPVPTETPVGTPTVIVPTPTPTETAAPTPTPTSGGSASLAFVEPVASLLR